VQLVIADTSPIDYLILIGHIDILPALFDKVILPSIVLDELTAGPPLIRQWIAHRPRWVEVHKTTSPHREASGARLDAGAEDAIALAVELQADLLLMDDREGDSRQEQRFDRYRNVRCRRPRRTAWSSRPNLKRALP
jgi:predicted nucleic acid-binding protein